MFSKTNYTDGLQCPKMLWMQKHMPEQRSDELVRQDLLDAGDAVGALARQWAGDHALIEQSFDFPLMAEQTARAMGQARTVCEATFATRIARMGKEDESLVCLVDILDTGPQGVRLREVKASTKVKPYHLQDAAFQAHVVRCAGHDVGKVEIVHLDGGYRLDGKLDCDALFAVEDVTEEVMALAADVAKNVVRLADARDSATEPDTAIGKHCNVPHPCPFQGWCWRDVADEGIFNLAGYGRVKGLKAHKEGNGSFDACLARAEKGEMRLNGLQRAQIRAETGKGDTLDRERLSAFLGTLSFPLYFLDFETVQHAVPAWQGCRPYQQVPTQLSLHWLDSPGGELRHAEHLAPSEGDPRRGVAEALMQIPEGACVTAYNASFEKGRIAELAEAFPDLAGRLMGIHDSIADLMVPFQKGMVYKEAMGGSYSIKKVLPAICPGDPELDYSSLEGVHNGAEAMAAFSALSGMEPQAEARAREQLLAYCRLDTLAMVKIWQWLCKAAA